MVHRSQDLRRLIYMALFIALIFVATNIRVHIPILMATGGLVHLGSLMLFVIAVKYGKTYGAVSGAIGMTIMNLVTEFAHWAPGTFMIRLTMGYVVGKLAETKEGQGTSFQRNVLALLAGGVVHIIGYWLYEGLFLGIGLVPSLGSVPGNILQIVIASFGLFLLKSMPELPMNQVTNAS